MNDNWEVDGAVGVHCPLVTDSVMMFDHWDCKLWIMCITRAGTTKHGILCLSLPDLTTPISGYGHSYTTALYQWSIEHRWSLLLIICLFFKDPYKLLQRRQNRCRWDYKIISLWKIKFFDFLIKFWVTLVPGAIKPPSLELKFWFHHW